MNLKQKLESLRFDDKKDFKLHINRIHEIYHEISTYGQIIEHSNLVQIQFKLLLRSCDIMSLSAAYKENFNILKGGSSYEDRDLSST